MVLGVGFIVLVLFNNKVCIQWLRGNSPNSITLPIAFTQKVFTGGVIPFRQDGQNATVYTLLGYLSETHIAPQVVGSWNTSVYQNYLCFMFAIGI